MHNDSNVNWQAVNRLLAASSKQILKNNETEVASSIYYINSDQTM